ncbi:MAG: hypothetical protein ACE367_26600 [Acidimicrobiales bacterium]
MGSSHGHQPHAAFPSAAVGGLARTQLLDCNGRITHTFTLLPDGTVEVATGSVRALVDPARKVVLRPRGFHLPDQAMAHAATLAAEGAF